MEIWFKVKEGVESQSLTLPEVGDASPGSRFMINQRSKPSLNLRTALLRGDIDVESGISAYLFTNGRSSYEYTYQSLTNQVMKIPTSVIRDRYLSEGMNSILETTNEDYFIKVDDDFFLHDKALAYLAFQVLSFSTADLFIFNLFEVFTSSKVQSIKVYKTEAAKEVGGFKPDDFGRIDRRYLADLKKSRKELYKDDSMLALHASTPWNEHLNYEKIWSKQAKFRYRKKHKREKIKRCRIPMHVQFKDRNKKLEKANKKHKTPFYTALRSLDEDCI